MPTVLIEAGDDFDRAFRGDTVHPSTLEMLDDLGLADAGRIVPALPWLRNLPAWLVGWGIRPERVHQAAFDSQSAAQTPSRKFRAYSV